MKQLTLLCTAVVVAFTVIIIFYFTILLPFINERKYIKMEIQRAMSEGEYKYWIKQLREFYIDNIPLLGRLIARFVK